MKRALFVTCIAAFAATTVTAQQEAMLAEKRATLEQALQAAAGSTRVYVETRVKRGAPYSADAITEFVQAFADGNRIVRSSTTRIYRDSEGRTRREALTEPTSIVISDPVAGVSYVLDPSARTAARTGSAVGNTAGFVTIPSGSTTAFSSADSSRVIITRPAGERATAEAEARMVLTEKMAVAAAGASGGDGRGGAMVAMPASAAAKGEVSKEDLGQQVIEGVTATGSRTTTTIPAGAIGNEQPLVTISEQWFSSELEVLVLTRHSDPRSGETTYRLANVNRSEPDRTLFQVPSDYTIKEPTLRRPNGQQQ